MCLGHRRLSIIDTSYAGHQPMFTDDMRFAVILNGEIYNYKEIREELKAKGEVFTTNSDTEVLLKAFREWNVGSLDKLNGMFAFAIWDDQEKTLILARDRVGLKPLYYSKIGSNLVFASEIKAILATRLVKAELDYEALNQLMTFLWPVPPHPFDLFPYVVAAWLAVGVAAAFLVPGLAARVDGQLRARTGTDDLSPAAAPVPTVT